mmetsp:Transcript_7871/g.16425  ORF Transcript_7871/g.16425 Transcript_7871/m.16425 type:complete len:915 (+) Transcript_7871:233-2977(+)
MNVTSGTIEDSPWVGVVPQEEDDGRDEEENSRGRRRRFVSCTDWTLHRMVQGFLVVDTLASLFSLAYGLALLLQKSPHDNNNHPKLHFPWAAILCLESAAWLGFRALTVVGSLYYSHIVDRVGLWLASHISAWASFQAVVLCLMTVAFRHHLQHATWWNEHFSIHCWSKLFGNKSSVATQEWFLDKIVPWLWLLFLITALLEFPVRWSLYQQYRWRLLQQEEDDLRQTAIVSRMDARRRPWWWGSATTTRSAVDRRTGQVNDLQRALLEDQTRDVEATRVDARNISANNNNNSNNNNHLVHQPPPQQEQPQDQQQPPNNPLPNNPASSNGLICVSGTFPPGRNGHSATLVTDDDDHDDDQEHPESGRIIVLGGWLGTGPLAASDMHVLDISQGGRQLRWYQPALKGTPPGPCNMHSADYVKSQKAVYVFRGGNGREYLNDLHALNVDTMVWSRVETTGAIPQQRANHSSATLDDELFIFGGWNGSERLNDIHILDTRTKTWTCPHVGGVLPHPRAGMTLTALRGRLYLFGGSGTSAKCFQDLQILDRQKMAWLDVSTEEEVPKPSTTGGGRYEEESSRYHHHHHHPHAYYGGGAQQPPYEPNGGVPYHHNPYGEEQPQRGDYNDSRVMMNSGGGRVDWRHRARHHHHATSVSNPNDEDSVPSVLVQGLGPGRRAGHTATAVNRKIYVFGGSCGSDYLNDFYVLDTDPPPQAVVTESNSLELMERRLSHFFNDEEFADVVFLVQGQRVYGHKMVLSIVSDCFRAMFSAGFRESSSDHTEITIPDCSHAAFLAVMEYIYTGALPKGLVDTSAINGEGVANNSDSASSLSSPSQQSTGGNSANGASGSNLDSSQWTRVVELLELADRFFLDHLKQVCESLLQSQVSTETVEYLAAVAQKTNANQLQDICQHYLRNRE